MKQKLEINSLIDSYKDFLIYEISIPRRRAHAIAALPSSTVIPNFNN